MTAKKFARKHLEVEVVPVADIYPGMHADSVPEWVMAYLMNEVLLFQSQKEGEPGLIMCSTVTDKVTHCLLGVNDYLAYSEDIGLMALSREELEKYYYELPPA